MQVSSAGVIETKGFEMPFLRFFGIIASCYMPPFEPDTHLINVNILMTDKEPHESEADVIKEGGYSPKYISLLSFFLLFNTHGVGICDVECRLEHFESITCKTFLYERIGVARVLGPIAAHSWLSFDPHMQKDTK